MICPQCGREMEPIISIPFRWQCGNHPMRLFVQEPLPTLWYLDPPTNPALEEARLAEQWANQLAGRRRVIPPSCPSCYAEMQYNLVMNQWECNRYAPPFIITDAEMVNRELEVVPAQMTATEVRGVNTGRIALDMQGFLNAVNPPTYTPQWVIDPVPPPIGLIPSPTQPWSTLDSFVDTLSKPERIAERLQKELEAANRDKTVEWFNEMPKALKLLYIAGDKDSQEMLEHFKTQDTRFLTFRNMYGSCQRMLIRAYIARHKETT